MGGLRQRQWNIVYKISGIVLLLLFFIVDLIGLNVVTLRDATQQINHINTTTLPRLVLIRSITDSLNQSIVLTYEYTLSGDSAQQAVIDTLLQQTVVAQADLFQLAETEDDFAFSKEIELQTNQIADTIQQLFATPISDEAGRGLRLNTLSITWSQFRQFVNTETTDSVQRYRSEASDVSAASARRSWLIGGAIVLFSLIMSWVSIQALRRWITRPIEELTQTARSMARGEFRFVDIESHDEFGLLADTFNTMAQQMKATQESLSIELAKAQTLDKQKTEFVSIAAHQLRTPMSGIKWLVSMAAAGDLGAVDPAVKTELTKGLGNIDRMIRLINNLLDVTQVEAHDARYQLAPVVINELLAELCEQSQQPAQAQGITLTCVPDPAAAQVEADRDKLSLAIRNIIDNAIKYTPAGGTVTVTCRSTQQAVQIMVTDTGYGIPEADLQHIFTKFFRGSNIQSIVADGSGLGLFLVKQIVTAHHGEVTIDSTVNVGSTFTIELPRSVESAS